MNENERERPDARRLATQALEELNNPSLSLEVPVRTALRVAALKKHTHMQAWLHLQLVDFRRTGNATEVISTIHNRFPDLETANRVHEQVANDYLESRSMRNRDQIFGSPISELEAAVREFEQTLRATQSAPPREALESATEMSGMLQGIRNRVMDYLVKIESS